MEEEKKQQPLFFDIKNDPEELHNLAADSNFSGLMFEYARKMLSWRMANDERTLTGMKVGLQGLFEKKSMNGLF